jgi:peptidoglycan/xylan/chitin deacetylase (PgdA/CDA1 family)
VTIISLEYHDVVPQGSWETSGFPGPAAASYKLASNRFVDHLEALATATRPAGTTVQHALAGAGDCVLLTFDDGGQSAVAIGAMLSERGWHAHIFMVSDRISTPGFLRREELRGLHADGHIIGSHSATHPTRMSHLSPSQLRSEWDRSVAELQDAIGAPVKVASVPGGYYSTSVAEAAAGAGIEVLFTSEPVTSITRVGSCHVMGRFTLRQAHPAEYVRRLTGASPLARGAQWLQWNTRKVGKRLGGSAYLRFREAHFRNRSS